MREFLIKNENELAGVARELVSGLKGGENIGLIGDLGAGKTTLVRAMVGALGSVDRVKSPTFAIVNEYKIDSGELAENIKMVRHMDLYRFESPVELEALAFDHDEDVVTFVEWPNIFEERSFPVEHEIRIEALADGSRLIKTTL